MEEHEVFIVEQPPIGDFGIVTRSVFCTCGAVARVLPGWYITAPGAELWKRKHLAVANGDEWASSTAAKDLRVKSFLEKVEDAERQRQERDATAGVKTWGRSF